MPNTAANASEKPAEPCRCEAHSSYCSPVAAVRYRAGLIVRAAVAVVRMALLANCELLTDLHI